MEKQKIFTIHEGFISEFECRAYLDKKYKNIETTLNNYIKRNTPKFSITYLTCNKKSIWIRSNGQKVNRNSISQLAFRCIHLSLLVGCI